ncbi:MAG: acetolactate synthase small subunit [Acidaminococcaceae bacterium]
MEQVISIIVRNHPGVLMRVAGMFSRRGFNIDSLAVGITHNPDYSRMTVTMQAEAATITQVCKQLAKLVEVEQVKVLPPQASAKRSMALVKVKTGTQRLEILKVADVFRAQAIDVTGGTLTFLITGVVDKLHAFVEVMSPYGILEMVQTGSIALERGEEVLTVEKSRFLWPEESPTGQEQGTII